MWLARDSSERPFGCWLNRCLRSASAQKVFVCHPSQFPVFTIPSFIFSYPKQLVLRHPGYTRRTRIPHMLVTRPLTKTILYALMTFPPLLTQHAWPPSIPTLLLRFPAVFRNRHFHAACAFDAIGNFTSCFSSQLCPSPSSLCPVSAQRTA